MLLGSYFTKLDEKARLAVPKNFREELGKSLVVARWYEGCLVLVNTRLWQDMVARLTGGELAILSARDTDRFLLAGSFEVELDSQGRFVVPFALRYYAKITGEVVFAGLGNRVEIWSKRDWEEKELELVERAGSLAQKLFEQKIKRTR